MRSNCLNTFFNNIITKELSEDATYKSTETSSGGVGPWQQRRTLFWNYMSQTDSRERQKNTIKIESSVSYCLCQKQIFVTSELRNKLLSSAQSDEKNQSAEVFTSSQDSNSARKRRSPPAVNITWLLVPVTLYYTTIIITDNNVMNLIYNNSNFDKHKYRHMGKLS